MKHMKHMTHAMTCKALGLTAWVLAAALGSGAALAQEVHAGHYMQQTGADLYHGICQGCHMPDAQGAVGAGAYPALARDKHLRARLYPVAVVLHGRKAMPAFGSSLSDAQVAAVVNFIRTRFGNRYRDTVTPAQVKTLR